MAGAGAKHKASPPTNRSNEENVASDKIGEEHAASKVEVINTGRPQDFLPARGDRCSYY